MSDDAPLAKKITAPTSSAGSAIRPSSDLPPISEMNPSRATVSFGKIMSVATGPGTKQFTRIPREAHSIAIVAVQFTSAAFTALYPPMPAMG
jgi:hypothetical protein